ncbi:serine/threonine-protein phosphatase PP2A-2 catalytic subunit [Pelomyxa schiedti]|nr:serine/threonine-protein phosphatase PP2A-2 catalytic subunit [Pelomyxa schiedti]
MERVPLDVVGRLCVELAAADDGVSSWRMLVAWPCLWRATRGAPGSSGGGAPAASAVPPPGLQAPGGGGGGGGAGPGTARPGAAEADAAVWLPLFLATGGDLSWFPRGTEESGVTWRERFLENMRGPLRKAREAARSILARHQWFMSTNYGNPGTIGDNEVASLAQLMDLPPVPELDQLHALTKGAIFLLKKEPNLITLQFPIVIVGDIHGQLEDLHHVFKLLGSPQQRSFLFLGDYVDKGYHSLQCISLIFALKILFPSSVTLLRGNHETRQMTQVHGLCDECKTAYEDMTSWESSWEWLCDAFECLPLAATVGNKVFAVHGGPSPELTEISDILKLDRFVDITTDEGIITDLLWSDPDSEAEDWSLSPRGAGHLFGHCASESFLNRNNLQFIIRSHQLVMEGIHWEFDNRVCTIYSCSNYAYRCGNSGAAVVIEECTGRHSGTTTVGTMRNEKILAGGTILVREIAWPTLPLYPYPSQMHKYFI